MDRKKPFAFALVCCIAVLFFVFSGCSFLPKQGKSPRKGGEAVQKATSSSPTRGGSERIAFSKDGDVWTMKPDGSDKKQLTNTSEYEFSLSFSKKAGRIWFIRTTSTKWEKLPTGEVWSMKVDGEDVKRITTGQMKIRFAAVSPDGKKIGISLTKMIPELYPGGPAGETSDLWIMDANAPDQTEASEHIALSDDLAADGGEMGREGSTFCAWSPDSKKIAFTFKDDGSASLGISTRKIYIANKDGSDRKQIGASMDQPAFSPSNKYIAAPKGMHWDTIGLQAITTSGEDYKEIVPMPTGELYSVGKPAWLDNTRVVYSLTTHPSQQEASTTTLYSSNLKTSTQTSVVTKDKVKGSAKNPAVDFTGKKIVFEVEHFYAQGGETTSYIWIVNADGGSLTQITSGPEDTGPIWIEE